MDDWAFFQIRKSELELDDERPFSRDSNAALAHYAVDPSQDFRKIEAGIRVEPAVREAGISRNAQRPSYHRRGVRFGGACR
jgi:hypothetical protein